MIALYISTCIEKTGFKIVIFSILKVIHTFNWYMYIINPYSLMHILNKNKGGCIFAKNI